MKIADLVELQNKWIDVIESTAKNIHPKLLSVLNYYELFDDQFKDPKLEELYNTIVVPKIKEYENVWREERNKFLLEYCNDMALTVESIGYYAEDGSEVFMFNDRIPDDFVPGLEIEHVWNYVHSMNNYTYFSPFWKRQGYVIIGDLETINIHSSSTPKSFIDENRAKFHRSRGKTNLDLLEQALKLKETEFDYDIFIPALTQTQDNGIPVGITDAVRRHMILKHVIENYDELKTHLRLASVLDDDGNLRIMKI